jgi:hypothetical protein
MHEAHEQSLEAARRWREESWAAYEAATAAGPRADRWAEYNRAAAMCRMLVDLMN